jgi:hypothetical protein
VFSKIQSSSGVLDGGGHKAIRRQATSFRSWCCRSIGVRTDQGVWEGPKGREACIA